MGPAFDSRLAQFFFCFFFFCILSRGFLSSSFIPSGPFLCPTGGRATTSHDTLIFLSYIRHERNEPEETGNIWRKERQIVHGKLASRNCPCSTAKRTNSKSNKGRHNSTQEWRCFTPFGSVFFNNFFCLGCK
ncbi:hypothetical protein QBC45DRAFT_407014 [Copromyces sp. CBS 386.78]|nr:hypothetical protein QBC45DRAFT_407014 [Copromyces sp. CBS 386.78]